MFCKNCNEVSKKKIDNELDLIIKENAYQDNEIINKRAVAYCGFTEKYPDAFTIFGDPCNLGIDTRREIKNIIEDKYYKYLCECQKRTLQSYSQSPIETLLINGLIERGFFKDCFDKDLNIATRIQPQTAVYETGEMVLGFTNNDVDKERLESLGLINYHPFTVIDIYIEARKNEHLKFNEIDRNLIRSHKKLAIYADGHEFHERTKQQAQRDRSIDRKLQKLGFVVFRFTGSEIYRNIDKCCEEIIAEINTFR